jgi:hypothetical protein
MLHERKTMIVVNKETMDMYIYVYIYMYILLKASEKNREEMKELKWLKYMKENLIVLLARVHF